MLCFDLLCFFSWLLFYACLNFAAHHLVQRKMGPGVILWAAMFACLIIRIFRLVFSAGTVFSLAINQPEQCFSEVNRACMYSILIQYIHMHFVRLQLVDSTHFKDRQKGSCCCWYVDLLCCWWIANGQDLGQGPNWDASGERWLRGGCYLHKKNGMQFNVKPS